MYISSSSKLQSTRFIYSIYVYIYMVNSNLSNVTFLQFHVLVLLYIFTYSLPTLLMNKHRRFYHIIDFNI